MELCGHCGGMNRHHLGCRFSEIVRPSAPEEVPEPISSHDPRHAASAPAVPRLSVLILTGLATMFAVAFVAILIWR